MGAWREFEDDERLVARLREAPFRLPNSELVEGISRGTSPYLRIGDESLELDWTLERRPSWTSALARVNDGSTLRARLA